MDGFAHSQFLRYRTEDNYRTFLGGCITVVLIITFTVMFAGMIIGTFQSTIISSSSSRLF